MAISTKTKPSPPKPSTPKTSTRITGQSIRENAKKDLSPKWDGAENWSGEQFTSNFHSAMAYYNLNNSSKDMRPKIIDWMAQNEYTKTEILSFKVTKEWRATSTMGALAHCLLRGMPGVHLGFNGGKSSSAWLRKEISKVIEEGQNDVAPIEDSLTSKVSMPVYNIQDRLREQAAQMSEEIDEAIDSWITDPESFDPKAFKMVSLLRGKGAKAAQARFIKSFYEREHVELLELTNGSPDEQLREGYKHHPRKNIKKLVDFYNNIVTACEQIAAEAKVLKKPRAKKVKPAEDLVKKLKFKIGDDKLGITSVPPASLIGAQSAVVYNVRTRKIGYYIAKTSAGLNVKGTSIIDFTEKSVQKTFRKPEVQIKEFKEQNTQKRFETWFDKNVKTTETPLNGRLGEDVVILKAYK